ncbi:MAG: indolepyruvate oxidoreductase subunit beta [Candidatus Bipolaricaulaceae bacterium]
MRGKLDFLVAGVGGQGTVLASDILAEVGVAAGYDVKKSDVLGLAVRGGSVLSHVRWGEEVASPVVPRGGADYLLGFEPLEALRGVEYLSPASTALVNAHPIPPVSVSSGGADYPSLDRIESSLAEAARRTLLVDATAAARAAGSVRAANVALLGALSTLIDVPEEVWREVVERRVPAKYQRLNLDAFQAGRGMMNGGTR